MKYFKRNWIMRGNPYIVLYGHSEKGVGYKTRKYLIDVESIICFSNGDILVEFKNDGLNGSHEYKKGIDFEFFNMLTF